MTNPEVTALLDAATNPTQYDAENLDWALDGGPDAPVRRFLGRVIDLQPADVADRSVLEVGCGMGWFLRICADQGAAELVGIEPSEYSQWAQDFVPEADIRRQRFEDMDTTKQFNFIAMIMSTEHMGSLPELFARSRQLLKAAGRLLVITGDHNAFLEKRFDYKLTKATVQPGKESVVAAERPSSFGPTTDIVRTVDYWTEAAHAAGFDVAEQRPVHADEELIHAIPKYIKYLHQPVMQLFTFRKTEQS